MFHNYWLKFSHLDVQYQSFVPHNIILIFLLIKCFCPRSFSVSVHEVQKDPSIWLNLVYENPITNWLTDDIEPPTPPPREKSIYKMGNPTNYIYSSLQFHNLFIILKLKSLSFQALKIKDLYNIQNYVRKKL
jgi:hypothetical protein